MNASTAVQPLDGRLKVVQNQSHVLRLVEIGADTEAATMLIQRITGSNSKPDKDEAAAIQSFVNLVVELSSSGGRLTSVS